MQTTQASPASRFTGMEVSLFGLLLVVDSLHFVFARAFVPYFDSLVAGALVMTVAAVELAIYGIATRAIQWRSLVRDLRFFALVGFLVGGSTALGYLAVHYIDVGTASMLGKMSTLFSLLIGVWWLRERLTLAQLLGGLLAVVGVLIITFQPGDILRIGSLLVIASTVMYALHAAVVKRHGQEMDFITFFFGRVLFTSIILMVFAVGRPLTMPPVSGWLLLLLAGTVDVVVSRALYYLALRRLPMTLHAIVLTLSPVATLLWALFLFDTFPQSQQLMGGITVLCGVLIATFSRAR